MHIHSIKLSDSFQCVEILPLSDLHIGDICFDRSLFNEYVSYILDKDNRFCFLNGDIIDNALRGSVGDTYRASEGPREQILDAVGTLRPLAEGGRLWGILGGNHENRTNREVGLCPGEIIADKLRVPYFGVQVLLKIRLGKNWHGRNSYYTIYATHGWGGGRLKGGKINNLDRMKNIILADIYCMGHTHTQAVLDGMIYEPDVKNDVIIKKKIYFVNSGCFLERGDGYAAEKGYEPVVLGCPVISLAGKERKISVEVGKI